VETLVSVPLLGLLVSAGIQLFLLNLQESRTATEMRVRTETRIQMEAMLRTALTGMIFVKRIDQLYANGPVQETFQPETDYEYARWQWENRPEAFAQLYPQLVGLSKNSGICLRDRRTSILFNKVERTLTLKYYRSRKDGMLVECLGGTSEDVTTVGPIVWKNVADAQLVRQTELGLEFYVRLEGEREWSSFDGGIPEA
jgi:hypothetical protein